MIRQGLKTIRGILISPKSAREEILQGVLSLGDERVGLAMLDTLEKGILWKLAVKERGVDIGKLLHRERSIQEGLPWDFIHSGIPKKVLWRRYQDSLN